MYALETCILQYLEVTAQAMTLRLGRRVGKGSSSGVYLALSPENGQEYVLKPYDDVQCDNQYKLSEIEQARTVHTKLMLNDHPLFREFSFSEDQMMVMTYLGKTLPDSIKFWNVDLIENLASYLSQLLSTFYELGLTMPDVKPLNICAPTEIILTYASFYSGLDFEHGIKVCNEVASAVQLTASQIMPDPGTVSVTAQRNLLEGQDLKLRVTFESSQTAEMCMALQGLKSVLGNGIAPTAEMRLSFHLVDYNAIYEKRSASEQFFNPARGTYCPYGRNFCQLFDSDETMDYAMWFSAGCTIGWAVLRHAEEHNQITDVHRNFAIFFKSDGSSLFYPRTRAHFEKQHKAVCDISVGIGGFKMPSPEPVIHHLRACRILE